MENELIKYISKFITLDDEEAKVLAKDNPVRTFKKGTTLLRESEIIDKCWFVLKGCVRQFHIIDGSEKTTFFYTENQEPEYMMCSATDIMPDFELGHKEYPSMTM